MVIIFRNAATRILRDDATSGEYYWIEPENLAAHHKLLCYDGLEHFVSGYYYILWDIQEFFFYRLSLLGLRVSLQRFSPEQEFVCLNCSLTRFT